MKIGFSGAHHSGKSTLSRFLIDEFGIPDETDFVLRHYAPNFGGFPTDDMSSQWNVFYTWCRVVRSKPSCVIDRTPLDHIIYAQTLGYFTFDFLRPALRAIELLDAIIVTKPVSWAPVNYGKKQIYGVDIQQKFHENLEKFLCLYDDRMIWPTDHFYKMSIQARSVYLLPASDLIELKTTLLREIMGDLKNELTRRNQ
jgi:hypothetical protein